jgi:hypothetical protein
MFSQRLQALFNEFADGLETSVCWKSKMVGSYVVYRTRVVPQLRQ